jgi:UDP-GlcNAc:undecaprenyl-phosphate GlcNAc-1-phosphate transferase
LANAFNCLDCADGVATSIALVAGGAFLVIAIMTRQPLEILLAAAIAGAALGFLPYNLHPARIFLGDAGSLTLGYFVAVLAVLVSPGILSVPALACKAVILAIPVYDIIRVHVLRFTRGKRRLRELLTSTGKDHLPHRLMERGISHSFVSVVLLVASCATGAAGVALATIQSRAWAIPIVLIAVATLLILEREWVTVAQRSERLASAGGLGPADGD